MPLLMLVYFVSMVLILFGITIFIHELGHFLVARRLGMQADVFSIGFGHAVWKKKVNGVVYKVGWIPFGGYVALPQMEPGGGATLDEDGNRVPLPRVAAWKKICVAAAGAAGNLLLAFLIAVLIWLTGKPSTLAESSSRVGFVATNSVAYALGLRIGDEVSAVNGEPVDNWESVTLRTAVSDRVSLEVRGADGVARTLDLDTAAGALGVKGVKGIEGVAGPSYCMVDVVTPGSSAEAAGVRHNDMIVSLAGETLHSIQHMIEVVEQWRDQSIAMLVERDRVPVELTVTPRYDPELDRVLIGIQFNPYHVSTDKLVHPSPLRQLREHAGLILFTLKSLVTPGEARNAATAIGGAPAIFQYLYVMLNVHILMALWFTSLLNVNLAIINLLPLPVLDGGHIVFSLVELVTGRPVHEKVVGTLTTVFAILLIAAMLFLSYRDIDRMFDDGPAPGGSPAPAPPAPAPTPP